MGKSYLQVLYDDSYKENTFYAWYRLGRPELSKLVGSLPPTSDGNKPGYALITRWRRDGNWDVRADALDALVSEELDKRVISERVQMLEKHAEMGKDMAEKGMKFLKDNGIESDSAAIRAVVEGIAIERNNRGMADSYLKVMSMSETELDKAMKQLLTGNEDNIIDADMNELTDDAAEETIPS